MTMVGRGSVLIALMLAGCAGGVARSAIKPQRRRTDIGMAGRWMLAAPNAPTCGMNFTGAPGAREGTRLTGRRLPGQILHEPALDASSRTR